MSLKFPDCQMALIPSHRDSMPQLRCTWLHCLKLCTLLCLQVEPLQRLSPQCAGAAGCHDGAPVETACVTFCVTACYMAPRCCISKVRHKGADSCLTVGQSSHPLLVQLLKAKGAGRFCTYQDAAKSSWVRWVTAALFTDEWAVHCSRDCDASRIQQY